MEFVFSRGSRTALLARMAVALYFAMILLCTFVRLYPSLGGLIGKMGLA